MIFIENKTKQDFEPIAIKTIAELQYLLEMKQYGNGRTHFKIIDRDLRNHTQVEYIASRFSKHHDWTLYKQV